MPRLSNPVFAVSCLVVAVGFGGSAAAQTEKTCTERMPDVRAMVDEISDEADKAVAEKQYKKIQQFFASGRERNCILYLEALRASIEAGDFSDI